MRFIRSPSWDGFWVAGGTLIGLLLATFAFELLPASYRGPWHGLPLDWRSWSPLIVSQGADWVQLAAVAIFALGIIVDTAHILSPMALTWTDRALRQKALARWRWFLLAPVNRP